MRSLIQEIPGHYLVKIAVSKNHFLHVILGVSVAVQIRNSIVCRTINLYPLKPPLQAILDLFFWRVLVVVRRLTNWVHVPDEAGIFQLVPIDGEPDSADDHSSR